MFTGLIEEVGTVTRIEKVPHGLRLRVAGATVAAGLAPGASVAVDGVCLTAVEVQDGEFVAEVSPETVACTNMAGYRAGARVNLERPLAADARLGGHFVQGHVDGVTRLRDIRAEGEFTRIGLELPDGLERYLVEKGSIAINGVSLTVASLHDDGFDVQLVPHTIRLTNLTLPDRAETMNVEVDILGKYVARMLEGHLHAAGVQALAGEKA
jgi:riboflavin synthase